MICRAAEIADIPFLVATTVAAYRSVFAPLLPDCDWTGFDERRFDDRFRRQWRDVVVAVDGGQRQGFRLMTGTNIDMLFVGAGRRRKGMGRALLRQAESLGALTLECFAVNTIARQFYERHGWVEASRHTRPFAGTNCVFLTYRKA